MYSSRTYDILPIRWTLIAYCQVIVVDYFISWVFWSFSEGSIGVFLFIKIIGTFVERYTHFQAYIFLLYSCRSILFCRQLMCLRFSFHLVKLCTFYSECYDYDGWNTCFNMWLLIFKNTESARLIYMNDLMYGELKKNFAI
jgi:hypothetical protein